MSLKLMYITNQVEMAKVAEKSGVDWIFIDLEINGKVKRQGHLNTVISRHSIDDVKRIKKVLDKSELLVRINPIYTDSKKEIDKVINNGADIVMLPFFKTKYEVELFVNYVDNRAKVCLLCETSEAVENMDSILTVPGIDYIHIGLNDLHLSYKMKFMFEPLANGTVEMLCKKFDAQKIAYGFGGVAQLGQGALPAENIIAEHYRLGSTMAILSRSFYKPEKIKGLQIEDEAFKNGVFEIRKYEEQLLNEDQIFFENNRVYTKNKIMEISISV